MWPFKYPYTNFHELNLDWILEKLKEVSESVKNIPSIVRKEVDAVFESGAVPTNYPPRKILYIGDSYFTGVGGTGNDIPKMVEKCTPVSKWWNYAVGGTGFVRNPDNSSYINQIKKAFSDLGEEANEVTDIVVGGTYNDVYYVTNKEATSSDFFLPYITEFRNYCVENFKNAKLHVFPGLYTGAGPSTDTVKTWQYIKTACGNAGVAHADYCINWLLGYDESVDSSDIHPSAKGYRIIGQNIAQILNGGEVVTRKKVNLTSNTFTGEISISFFNDFAEYYFNFQPTSAMPSGISSFLDIPDRYFRRAHGNAQIFLMPYAKFRGSDAECITFSSKGFLVQSGDFNTSMTYVGTYIEPLYPIY